MNNFRITAALFTIFMASLPAHQHESHGGDAPKMEEGKIIGHGNFRYRVDPSWGQLDPEKYKIKNCHAMVELGSGDLLALCDDNKHNFLLYGADGKLKKAWGTEYPGAHGLEIFTEGKEEFLIVVDGGWAVREGKQYRETGRVAKTKTNGQLVFSLGHPQTVGAYEPGQTFMPCDAAVGPNGDIYIADGYGSQWVLQYDEHGKFIRKFGGATDPNPEARLKNSHGVSIDYRDPKNPKLMVSSRSEQKLKFFTLDGKFLESVYLPGALGGQAVQHGENLYIGVCWSRKEGKKRNLPRSGFVLVLDKDNKVVSCPGGSEPVYKEGKLQPLSQDEGTFMHVHDLCVDRKGNIYVVQWNSEGAYPIKLEKLP